MLFANTMLSVNMTNNDKSPENLLVVTGKYFRRSMVWHLSVHVTSDNVISSTPEINNLFPVCV